MRNARRPAGFVFLDSLAGLLLLAAVLAMLATALHRNRAISTRLNDDRAATRLAELTLLKLRAGDGLPDSSSTTRPATQPTESSLHVERIDTDAPLGHTWTRVTATVRGRSSSLVGLIPSPNLSSVEGATR